MNQSNYINVFLQVEPLFMSLFMTENDIQYHPKETIDIATNYRRIAKSIAVKDDNICNHLIQDAVYM